ncbi:MAG: succinate dehydrogenase [Sulfolobaceae archaeon]
MEDEIVKVLKDLGAEVGNWVSVSERPGRRPFGKEVEYKLGDLFWGKVHLRDTGEIYVLVINKDVFNWKDRTNELKVKGNVVDAAGGLLWLEEEKVDDLKIDLDFIKSYLSSLKASRK